MWAYRSHTGNNTQQWHKKENAVQQVGRIINYFSQFQISNSNTDVKPTQNSKAVDQIFMN